MKPLEIKKYAAHILVCQGNKCSKQASKETYKELRHHFKRSDLAVRVTKVDCFGECKQACVVAIEGHTSVWLGEVKAKHKHIESIKEEVRQHLERYPD